MTVISILFFTLLLSLVVVVVLKALIFVPIMILAGIVWAVQRLLVVLSAFGRHQRSEHLSIQRLRYHQG